MNGPRSCLSSSQIVLSESVIDLNVFLNFIPEAALTVFCVLKKRNGFLWILEKYLSGNRGSS